MIKLYDFELSGNCHKIRMLLAMLGLEYERIDTDIIKGRDQFQPQFLSVNPFHKVPVLVDADLTLRDSVAIMVYLARTHNREDLLPTSARELAEVQQWLSYSVNEIFNGFALARALVIFNRPIDPAVPCAIVDETVEIFEKHLADREWLALDRFTLADLACYPYMALVHEGNIDLSGYPNIQAWFARIEALPDYVGMRGLPSAVAA